MTLDSVPPEAKSAESIIALDTRSIGTGKAGGSGVVTEKHLLSFGSNVLVSLAFLM